MKARENALRIRRHVVDEKNRKVEDLERMIREFEVMAADLDRQIQAEEDRTGIRDRSHFSYPTFAKSAAQRRDNLRTSNDAMREQLAAAIRERNEATEQYARFAAQNEAREDMRAGVRRRVERGSGAAFR